MWRNFVSAAAVLLATAVGATGLLQAAGAIPVPMALAGLAARLPVLFPLHMASASVALLMIAPVLAARRWPAFHRVLGRVALAAVAVGGLTALPSALASDAGPLARVGFFVQGLLWLGFAAMGYRHARARRIGPHRSFMARMVAVAAGAILVRLLLAAVSWAGMVVHASYGAVAWAAWLLPLAAVEARLRREAATAGRARSDRGCNRRPGTLS